MKRFFKFISLVAALNLSAQTTILRPDKLQIGKGADDKTIVFDKGSGSANPKIKWDNTASKLQFSDDGTSFTNFGTSIAIAATKTSNYTTTVNDKIVYVDGTSGAFTLTLHTPTFNQEMILERIDNVIGNQISISGTVTGKDNTDYTNLKFYTVGEKYHLQYNTLLSKWKILAHDTDTGWVTSEPIAGFYTFTISTGSASAAATYTNNGNTYIVTKTVASGTTVVMAGPAAPTASGTLTKSAGTGDATLTFSVVSGNPYKISATGGTIPTFYGTPTYNTMQWKRFGSMVLVKVKFYQTVGGVVIGVGDYIFPTPTGITIDTTYWPVFTGGAIQGQNSQVPATIAELQSSIRGRGSISGGQYTILETAPYTSTSYRVFGQYNNGDGAFSIGATYLPASTAGLTYIWEIMLPVSGWLD